MNKIDYNKKMLGKEVLVKSLSSEWLGKVIEVLDDENVLVMNKEDEQPFNVNIYDIRSINDEKKD
jgi:hypothetical protein